MGHKQQPTQKGERFVFREPNLYSAPGGFDTVEGIIGSLWIPGTRRPPKNSIRFEETLKSGPQFG